MTAPDEFDVNRVNDQLLQLYSCQFKWWWKAACNESKEKCNSCSCPQKINATKSDSAKSEIWSCHLVMTYGVKYETLVFTKCCDVSIKLTSDFFRLKNYFVVSVALTFAHSVLNSSSLSPMPDSKKIPQGFKSYWIWTTSDLWNWKIFCFSFLIYGYESLLFH